MKKKTEEAMFWNWSKARARAAAGGGKRRVYEGKMDPYEKIPRVGERRGG